MKQSITQTESGGVLRALAESWNRFWFSPADPTMLGVIRIIAGVLTLYVHLAYSYDLQEFMGRNAWMGLDYANQARWEQPSLAPPSGWTMVEQIRVYTPEDPDIRASFIDFLRRVADDPRIQPAVQDWLNPPPAPPGGISEPEVPRGLAVPAYVLNLPYLQNDPRSKQAVAQYLRSLSGLDKAERDHYLDYLNEWRIDPRDAEFRGGSVGLPYWSIWFHVTEPAWMTFTHVAILVIMVCFVIGFCTRITSVLTWLAALSYIQRSPITLFGSDVMMNILLIYLMIGPSGAALSVDRLIRRWWEKRQARNLGLPEPAWQPPQPMVSANLAIRLIQIHFCIIYLSAGTSKLTGAAWWNGTAVYYTLANYEFSLLRFAFFESILRFVSAHRWLWEVLMTAGSYFTLALELGFPLLIWNQRARPFLIVAALMLHCGIAIFMGLFAFQMFMATMLLAFVPGSLLRRAINYWQGRSTPAMKREEEEEEVPAVKSAAFLAMR